MFASIVEQQTKSFRQNLQMAVSQGHDRTPQGLSQILTYVAGVSVFLSTYEPLAQQYQAQGLRTLSDRVSELRNEVTEALTKYQAMFFQVPQNPVTAAVPLPIAPVAPVVNNPPQPLSTPDQITAFYAHLKELADLNKQAETQSENIRKSYNPD